MPPRIIALALLLVAPPSLAQDLSPIVGLFKNINSVSIEYGRSLLLKENPGSGEEDPFEDHTMTGVGAEVFIDLPAPDDLSFELGLGTRYSSGLGVSPGVPDLSLALRSLPSIALYGTSTYGPVEPYLGASFGITSLWNSAGVDDAGNSFDVTGTTYDYGFSGGLSLDLQHYGMGPVGLFVEGGYVRRVFGSVSYKPTTEGPTVPEEWPRRLDLTAVTGSVGVQVNLTEDAPASFPGAWLLRRIDGQALPTVWRLGPLTGGVRDREEIVGGRLDLTSGEVYKKGTYALTVHVRRSNVDDKGVVIETDPTLVGPRVIASGGYDVDDEVLILCSASLPTTPARDIPECLGREAGGVAANRDTTTLVVFDPGSGHVFTFEKASD